MRKEHKKEQKVCAMKEVTCNTQNCVARAVKAKIQTLRRKCLAIHRTVSQDSLFENESTRCDTTNNVARQL